MVTAAAGDCKNKSYSTWKEFGGDTNLQSLTEEYIHVHAPDRLFIVMQAHALAPYHDGLSTRIVACNFKSRRRFNWKEPAQDMLPV